MILLHFIVKSKRQRSIFKAKCLNVDHNIIDSFDIIIAAKESEELIYRCLSGLKDIGINNVYLCIDGGDIDMVNKIKNSFPGYCIFHNKQSEGKIKAQLKCLSLSSKPNILVLDADIILIKERLKEFLSYFISSNVDFLCPYSLGFYQKNNWLSKIAECDRYMRQRIVRAGRDAYGVSNLSGYCIAAKREKYREIIDTKSIQDDVSATISLLQMGYSVMTFHQSICKEIERNDVKSYILQKTRWTAGNICLIPKYKVLFANAPLNKSIAFSSSFLLWYWSHWINTIAFITAFFYPPLFSILIIEGISKFAGLRMVRDSDSHANEVLYITLWPLLSTLCLLMTPYYLIGKITENATRR